jgi:ATP-dependent Zn protease
MELKRTAIHEAGHVVVGYVLGLACNEVALTHDEVEETGAYGHATGPNPASGYEFLSMRERQETLRAKCTACCAGLAAEHVFCDVPLSTDNENAQDDFQNIIECERNGLRIRGKRNGFIGDDATWHCIDLRLIEAKKLVKRHRNPIQRLADALVERKKLDQDEVERLLEKWVSR